MKDGAGLGDTALVPGEELALDHLREGLLLTPSDGEKA